MDVNLTVLGTSAAVPAHKRHLSSHLLETDTISILFDCGEATQFQLKRFKKDFFKIDYIFISHLHGDHFLGLPGLISTMNMMGRKSHLVIFSPPGLQKAIEPLFSLSNMSLDFSLEFIELSNIRAKKEVISNELFSISVFPLEHSVETYGYIFRRYSEKLKINKSFVEKHKDIDVQWYPKIKNGSDYIDGEGNVYKNKDITSLKIEDYSYAYCSDTRFNEAISEYIKSVDLLYHESTYLQNDEDKAILRKHSTAAQAARIAQLAEAKRLLLGHFSSRYKDVTDFKNEANDVFQGEVILAKEGLEIKISN